MKIKLIAPARKPSWGENFWDLKTFANLTGHKVAGTILALPTLAALTPEDVDVVITDENVEKIDFEEEIDLVGISFISCLASRAYEIAYKYKSKGVKVILGGIHASMAPSEAIKHADSVLIGEAEEVWPKVIFDLKNNNLKKFYKSNNFPSLEFAPIPRWDLLKVNSYCYFTIQTSRGCPFNCDFCSVQVFNGRTLRHKKISNVLKEIQFLKNLDPKKAILFADDNLLANQCYADKLLDSIQPLEIQYWAQASINKLTNENLLEKLYKSGCRAVFIGIESVSQKSLDNVSKGRVNSVDKYKETINKIHNAGIGVFASFILGMENDDKKIFSETMDFINNNNIAFSMINLLTPLPGTKLFEKYKNKNLDSNWFKYDGEHICFESEHQTKQFFEDNREKLLLSINSYSSMYKRLINLWKNGVFVRKNDQPKFSKGRILLTLKSLTSLDVPRIWFVLKSLWGSKKTSITSILLALSFHDYVNNLKKIQR